LVEATSRDGREIVRINGASFMNGARRCPARDDDVNPPGRAKRRWLSAAGGL